MIPVHKLSQLSPGQRRRKLALLLAQAERELLAAGGGTGGRTADSDPDYVRALARLAAEDPKVEPAAAERLKALARDALPALGDGAEALLRLCDVARHAVLAAIGTFPAEWDLSYNFV